MRQIIFSITLVLLSSIIFAQGKVFIKGEEISSIDLSADVYNLEFNLTSESIKGAWMAKAKNFQYAIEVRFLQDGGCGLEQIYMWQDAVNGTSLTSLASGNTPFKKEIDGMKYLMTNAIKDCSSLPPDLQVAFNFQVLNKSGQLFTASQLTVDMPKDAKSASLAQVSKDAVQLFSSGMAADSYNNQALKIAVENYMENKWPDNDVTTVHLTNQKFTNSSQTAFDLDGYYITQITNGSCLYNSFYGEVIKNGSRYTITFFNSMDPEKVIDCSVSEKFKNL